MLLSTIVSRVSIGMLIGLSAFLTPFNSYAHHTYSMFDQTKEVVLTGVVREFQWTNPHTWVELDVTSPDGAVQGWSLEGGSINSIKRQGWSRTSLKPGDKVKVLINPLRDGKKGGALVGIVFADGTLRGKPVDPPAAAPAIPAQ